MGDKTKIEWCDATITPIRFRVTAAGDKQLVVEGRARLGEWRGVGWHCVHVSEGCRNCYAEAMNRWRGTGFAFTPEALRRGWIEPFLDEKHLLKPLHMRKPRRIFWCDMTDLFGDWVPDDWIDRIAAVCALTPHHTHIWLTKRPERMRDYLNDPQTYLRIAGVMMSMASAYVVSTPWLLPNVWGLVSVEDQGTADARIPVLLDTLLAVRGVSYEPAIGAVDLRPPVWMPKTSGRNEQGWECAECRIRIDDQANCAVCGGSRIVTRLDWVIIGGESGPAARPFDLAWARDVIAQCRAAGVAVFVKQLGAKPIDPWADTGALVNNREPAVPCFKHRKGGDPAEWPADLRVREFPA